MTDLPGLIPADYAARWRTRARRGSLAKLRSLLEFRLLVPDYKAENVLMQAYAEAASAMMVSAETLRDDMGKIREYSLEKLVYWIENGVSFCHMETANRLAEIAHKPPAKLLDQCIDPGNETGATMTVKELTAFALGEIKGSGKGEMINASILFERLGKFPTRFKWDDNKAALWLVRLKELKAEFFGILEKDIDE